MTSIYRIKFKGRFKNAPELFVDIPANSSKEALQIMRASIHGTYTTPTEEVRPKLTVRSNGRE